MKTKPLDVAIAELTVLLQTAVNDIAEIKNRLQIMDEQFARKEDVDKNSAQIIEMRNAIQTQEVKLAIAKAEQKSMLRIWAVVGGILVTLVSAAISALQIHF